MEARMLRNMENQLQLKDFKLHSLLEVTNAINLNKDVRDLTRLFEFIVREQLGYDTFILFNKN